MKRFVNGVEVELETQAVQVTPFGDRLLVHTSEGTFSALAVRTGDTVHVSYKGRQYVVEPKPSRVLVAADPLSGEIRAPMPGQIVDVRVQTGQKVAKGDVLLVLEAMKTQQPFTAPFDGSVVALFVQVGTPVNEGDVLAKVESHTDV
jgi:biotin carboxyl carrier protein